MEIINRLNDKQGSFIITENEMQVAGLDYYIENKIINAYHTGVRPEYEGKGLAEKLLTELVCFARKNELYILPSCSYILAKFKRNPNMYADVWHRAEDEPSGDACGLQPRK